MRPLPIAICSLLAVIGVAAPAADPPNPYDGAWRASYEGQGGAEREGSVIVEGRTGTWRMLLTVRSNPCFGREYPIVVQRATAEELVFEVTRSKLISGCPDTVMTFKPTDAKTLVSVLDNGIRLTLKRLP